jgi:ribosomal protein S18 acetylase RimI-like enzyme
MRVMIRTADVEDASEVLSLWRQAEAKPSHTDDTDSIRALVVHDPQALIVAEDHGHIVGSIIAGWDGWRGSIYRLAVAPAHRRGGLGSQLVEAAERRLAKAGAARLQAIVVETNLQATAFWRATGWEQQVERLRFVKG